MVTDSGAPPPAVPSLPVVRIVWGSTSGHTEYVVDRLVEELELDSLGYRFESCRAETLQLSDLVNDDVVVLASSTWNTGGVEGQLNPHMGQLLKRDGEFTLSGKRCACVGLGDHRYFYRVRAADLLEQFVRECGGRLIVPTLRIVDEPYGQEQTVRQWGHELAMAIAQ